LGPRRRPRPVELVLRPRPAGFGPCLVAGVAVGCPPGRESSLDLDK